MAIVGPNYNNRAIGQSGNEQPASGLLATSQPHEPAAVTRHLLLLEGQCSPPCIRRLQPNRRRAGGSCVIVLKSARSAFPVEATAESLPRRERGTQQNGV